MIPDPDASWTSHFGPFDGRIWLNTAHQGALPKVAADELERALSWKRAPHRIPDEAFLEVPRRLRSLLARLVGGEPDEIVLGNSASWGLQVIANGFPWRNGDEVLLVEGDYPPTIHPWLVLPARGVTVRKFRPRSFLIEPDELAREIRSTTKVVCTGWVNSFTGHVLDIGATAGVCRNVGAHLVLNGTQGVGAIPINVTSGGLSAISSSGFKWLCGPYATGFAWIGDELLADMRPFQSYWLAVPDGSSLDLNLAAEPALAEDIGARAFDVFGTANFFNFMPWAAALDLLLSVGIGVIAEHNKRLVGHLHTALDPAAYDWISPDANRGSAIVALSRRDAEANRRTVSHLSTKGIDVALRGGRVRISPHLYNDIADIDALVTGLHEASMRG